MRASDVMGLLDWATTVGAVASLRLSDGRSDPELDQADSPRQSQAYRVIKREVEDSPAPGVLLIARQQGETVQHASPAMVAAHSDPSTMAAAAAAGGKRKRDQQPAAGKVCRGRNDVHNPHGVGSFRSGLHSIRG